MSPNAEVAQRVRTSNAAEPHPDRHPRADARRATVRRSLQDQQ